MSDDTLRIVEAKSITMRKQYEGFEVRDDAQLETVAARIKEVKTFLKFIEQEKRRLTEPARAIIKEAGEKYDPYIESCRNVEEILKHRAKDYMTRRAEALTREQEKIAAKVEAGRMRPETAVAKMEALPTASREIRTESGAGLAMRRRKVARVKDAAGQSACLEAIFKTIGGDTAEAMVPAAFWMIDEVRARREALEREKNGLEPLPGVEVVEEEVMASV